MIKGHCHTNLDAYNRAQWPEEFVEVPKIGDRVEAVSGVSLKVVSITHTTVDVKIRPVNSVSTYAIVKEPCVKIELYK